MWGNSNKFHMSRANQRCPPILPTTLIWPITCVGFFHTARQRSTMHRVSSLWLFRLNFTFWALWNPKKWTQTFTRSPNLPVSRVWISLLYYSAACRGEHFYFSFTSKSIYFSFLTSGKIVQIYFPNNQNWPLFSRSDNKRKHKKSIKGSYHICPTLSDRFFVLKINGFYLFIKIILVQHIW